MRTPVFSVIVPCFNAGESFRATLASLRSQTFRDFELIVVDDGSQGPGREALEQALNEFSDLRPELVRFDVNAGPAAARNAGAERARGTYLSFLDSDDRWNRDRLATVHETLLRTKATVLGHRMASDNFGASDLSRTVELQTWQIILSNRASMSTLVVARSVFPGFDASLRYCEDLDLALRLLESEPFIFLEASLGELGRPVLSPGGHSASPLRMRLGEMSAYRNYCYRRPWRLLLLPGLLALSLGKHLRKSVARLCP